MSCTHSPFHPNHISAVNNLTVLANSPHGFGRVAVPNAEAIGDIRMSICFCRILAQRAEELYRRGVLVRGVSIHNDEQWLCLVHPRTVPSGFTGLLLMLSELMK
jgi:hypothetical protein